MLRSVLKNPGPRNWLRCCDPKPAAVDEKSAAFVDGCIAANIEMLRVFSAAAFGQFAPLFNAHVTITTAGLQPAFKTVNANARRLNRKATRG